MLRCELICPGANLRVQLEKLLGSIPGLEVVRSFDDYPTRDDLLRSVRMRRVEMVVVCLDDPKRAEAVAAFLDEVLPGFLVIAAGGGKDVGLMARLMHVGVRAHLAEPLDPQELAGVVEDCQQRLTTHPLPAARQADLYSFLPAKPGVGASTIAVSTACALAENLRTHTLLMDCDLWAGAVQFLLKLGKSASMADALMHSENLDEDLWGQMVGHSDGLDVLHAGRLNPPPVVEMASVARVLDMARPQYEVVCADLASSFEAFTVAMLQESRRILLVTTPELVALHMAAARVRQLTELGLVDRVSLVLNRKTRSALDEDAVAQAVGLPVTFVFTNDYSRVNRSVLDAAGIFDDSPLGQCVLNLAHTLIPAQQAPRPTRHRKFLEFFHVAREGDEEAA